MKPLFPAILLLQELSKRAVQPFNALTQSTSSVRVFSSSSSRLGQCVEKLQLLKTPAESQRKLEEATQIHADPNVNPSHEYEEDEYKGGDTRQASYSRPTGSGFGRKGMEPISRQSSGSSLNVSWSRTKSFSNVNRDFGRNMSCKWYFNKAENDTWSQGRETPQTNHRENKQNISSLETGARNTQSVVPSESSPAGSLECTPLSTGVAPLTDALDGKFQKDVPIPKAQMVNDSHLTYAISGKSYGTQDSQSGGVSWVSQNEINSSTGRGTPSSVEVFNNSTLSVNDTGNSYGNLNPALSAPMANRTQYKQPSFGSGGGGGSSGASFKGQKVSRRLKPFIR